MKTISGLMFLSMFASVANAQLATYDTSRLSEKGQRAFSELLNKTGAFAIGGVGYSGERSKGETALIDLLKESDSVNALVYLSTHANTEGALYALIGLRFKSWSCYEQQFPLVNALPPVDEVIWAFGCSMETVERSRLISWIEAGSFDWRFPVWERNSQ